MEKEIGKLYVTDDYDKFELIIGNRSVDKKHVKKLEQAVKSHRSRNGNSESPHNPCFVIAIDKNMVVIDGQHRLKASQNLNAFIGYYVIPNQTLGDIQSRQMVQRGWRLTDWLYSHVARGTLGYYQFNEFAKEALAKGIKLTSVLHLVTKEQHIKAVRLFKSGEFQVPNGYIQPRKHLEMLYQLKPYLGFYGNEKFVKAILPYFEHESFDLDYFLYCLKQVAGNYTLPQFRCSHSARENQEQLETLYNTVRKSEKKKAIYFDILPKARQRKW